MQTVPDLLIHTLPSFLTRAKLSILPAFVS